MSIGHAAIASAECFQRPLNRATRTLALGIMSSAGARVAVDAAVVS
jgi:hypothetical protein